jgi:hypothetical protein
MVATHSSGTVEEAAEVVASVATAATAAAVAVVVEAAVTEQTHTQQQHSSDHSVLVALGLQSRYRQLQACRSR